MKLGTMLREVPFTTDVEVRIWDAEYEDTINELTLRYSHGCLDVKTATEFAKDYLDLDVDAVFSYPETAVSSMMVIEVHQP